MHESHQVQHAVEHAQKMLANNKLARAARVRLLVGEALGFDEISVRLHWEEFVEATPLEGAELVIRFSPAILQCPKCSQLFPKKGSALECPGCRVLGRPTDSGKEFRVEAVE